MILLSNTDLKNCGLSRELRSVYWKQVLKEDLYTKIGEKTEQQQINEIKVILAK